MLILEQTMTTTAARLRQSRDLCASLVPLYAQARTLIRSARDLCLVHRRIRGGSDDADPTVDRLRKGDGEVNGGPSRSGSSPRPRPALVTQGEAVWQFLESRRGEMFCTQCIAGALFATKRIDRVILGAEGRGARRQYGPCAACGKERLLCGLTR
jgi:hypothetical protein